MHLGIAHHLGWAVAVLATGDHQVVERRRIELLEPGFPSAPVHHAAGPHPKGGPAPLLDDRALRALVEQVRASSTRAATASLDALCATVAQPIRTISLRAWPADFPDHIAVLRRAPFESRADSVMYRQVLTELAQERAWVVRHFDATTVETEAVAILGDRTADVLHAARTRLGPPWTKDHRLAFAATILAASAADDRDAI